MMKMKHNFIMKLKMLLHKNIFGVMTSFCLMICIIDISEASLWEQWWSYDSISGPGYWGRANPEWRLCDQGRQQSPINIQPNKLLFDPNLKNLKVEATLANSIHMSTHGLLVTNENELKIEVKTPRYRWINVTQGPLSYKYRVSEIKFHLANHDNHGSEHRIAGKAFPVEMHIIAYNSDLYNNYTEAAKGVKGLAIISVFLEIGKEIHKSLYLLTKQLDRHQRQARITQVKDISIQHLLPKTKEYMTYEGSLTQPACYETVTWIIMNKPLFVAKEQLTTLRVIHKGSENEAGFPVEVNSRPIMPLHNRVVRTNINGTRKYRKCSMEKNMNYQVNTRYEQRPIV